VRRALRPDEREDQGVEELAVSSPLEDEIFSLAREAAADRSTPDTPDDKLRIAVETVNGALPNLDRDLVLGIRDPEVSKAELEERTPRVNGLRALLSEMLLGSARIIRDYLGQMTYIGPLREIPTRSYRPQVTPDEARWAQGLAAWDLLHADRKGDLMDEVNRWLSGESQLRTGYRLERIEFKEVPVPGVFHQMFERGVSDDDIGELQELYQSLPLRSEIALRDFQKGILVAPGDVGVGISQMVKFQHSGHGGVAKSWVGSGPNQPISPGHLSSALGPSLIKTLAEKTGMSEQDVTAQLSNILPAFVDKLTPQGRVPTHDEIARHDA
jgi:uncharacterized protein YidB (DUF937 family)